MPSRLIAVAFPPSQFGRAAWIVFGGLAIAGTVWVLTSAGYRPCELCVTVRSALYVETPLALLTAFAAWRGAATAVRFGFVLLSLAFLANAALSGYRAGVEHHILQGPPICASSLSGPLNVNDMLEQIRTVHALRILGAPPVDWDFAVSAALGLYAALAARLKR